MLPMMMPQQQPMMMPPMSYGGMPPMGFSAPAGTGGLPPVVGAAGPPMPMGYPPMGYGAMGRPAYDPSTVSARAPGQQRDAPTLPGSGQPTLTGAGFAAFSPQ
jgi:hypothetical protein